MKHDMSGWLADLVRSLYEHRDTGKDIVFDETDDLMAKRAYEALVKAEGGGAHE